MKKIYLLSIVLFAILIGCNSSSKLLKENAVGILKFHQYALITPTISTENTYYIARDQREFDKLFYNTDLAHEPKINFTGKTVVGISTPKNKLVSVNRAAIIGNVLRVYASTCTPEKTLCPDNGLCLVTTPKSTQVTSVHFFIDGIEVKRISAVE